MRTSCPFTGPSPFVAWSGTGLIPSITELAAANLWSRTVTVNRRVPSALSRVSNATSDGELTRVGTWGVLKVGGPEVRATSESFGRRGRSPPGPDGSRQAPHGIAGR